MELVAFYEKHPFYNRVSLTLPVTPELIRRLGVVSPLPLISHPHPSHPLSLSLSLYLEA